MTTLKIIWGFIFLSLSTVSFSSEEFRNYADKFADEVTFIGSNVTAELSALEQTNSPHRFYANEIVFRVQPELGVSIVGVPSLKFAFTAEFTFTRKLPSSLILDKP